MGIVAILVFFVGNDVDIVLFVVLIVVVVNILHMVSQCNFCCFDVVVVLFQL